MAQSTQQDPAPRPMPRPEQGAPTKAFPSTGHAYAPGINKPDSYSLSNDPAAIVMIMALGLIIGILVMTNLRRGNHERRMQQAWKKVLDNPSTPESVRELARQYVGTDKVKA